jgi:ADP-heptose:LPS heptosyltransferase
MSLPASPPPVTLSPEPARIALFRALFVGDLLMTVPAFRALRCRFPDAEITLIGLPWARGFVPHVSHYIDRFVEFAGYPGIPEIEVDPARTARWLAEQRAYGYDLALQMHGDGTVTNALVAELGARVTAGFARPGDRRLTYSLPVEHDGHEILRWLTLTDYLGAPRRGARIDFPLTPDQERRADRLLAGAAGGSGPLIGLHAGSKAENRRWPPEKFAVLGDELVERFGARIVLTGSEGERPLTASVAASMRRPALNLAGRTGIGEFAAVLARLDLLVTNDTGASHMAAATRTRSVVLFGPEPPERFGPLDRNLHTCIDSLALLGGDPETVLRRLPVEPVLAECRKALAGRPALSGRGG